MYRFSLSAFLRLFQRSLEAKQVICQHLWVYCLSRIRADYWQVLAEVKVLSVYMCFAQVPISELSQKRLSGDLLLLGNISADYRGLRPFFSNMFNLCHVFRYFIFFPLSVFLFFVFFLLTFTTCTNVLVSFPVVSVTSFYFTAGLIGLKKPIKQHYNHPFAFSFKIISSIRLLLT